MSAEKLSAEILEIVPFAMRALRAEMRGIAHPELSVPHFRILARLDREPQTNKQMAEWIGVSTAAMSRTIDGLVKRGLVQRQATERDRREVMLSLTRGGKKKFENIKNATKEKLAERIKVHSLGRRKKLRNGLAILREVFSD